MTRPSDWLCPPDMAPVVARQVENCLRTQTIRRLLDGDEDMEIWREQSFEVVIHDQWLSGCFDRVQIHREAINKRITKIEVIDFKSNELHLEQVAEATQRYTAQMRQYLLAAAHLLGESTNLCRGYLLFTALGEMVEVQP